LFGPQGPLENTRLAPHPFPRTDTFLRHCESPSGLTFACFLFGWHLERTRLLRPRPPILPPRSFQERAFPRAIHAGTPPSRSYAPAVSKGYLFNAFFLPPASCLPHTSSPHFVFQILTRARLFLILLLLLVPTLRVNSFYEMAAKILFDPVVSSRDTQWSVGRQAFSPWSAEPWRSFL